MAVMPLASASSDPRAPRVISTRRKPCDSRRLAQILRLSERARRQACNHLGFGLIRNEVIGCTQLAQGRGQRRCRVDDAADPIGPGKSYRVVNRLERNFKLQNDDVRLAQIRSGGINICGS